MAKDLEVLKGRVERLRRLHLRALGAYYALEEMLKFIAPNIVGDERAHKNAEAIGVYKGYLNTARKALNTELHMALAKIYDDHKDALHIVKLVNYAVGNKKALTAADPDAEAAEELAEVYEGLTSKEQQEIANDLQQANDKIKRLKDIRNKIVAHEDPSAPDDMPSVSFQELDELIQLHDKIINTISRKYYGNAALFDVYKDQVILDSKSLLQLVADEYDKSRAR
jgi:hypothetical protein